MTEAWTRFRAKRGAMTAAILLAVIVLACLLGPAVLPHDAQDFDFSAIEQPPGWASGHWAGTDELGRDILARTLAGGRISLLVGAVATLVALVIGVAYGAVAGLIGGWGDGLMMRIVDVMFALPFIFFTIVLTLLFGQGLVVLFLALGLVNWLTIAVIVRGRTLELKQRPFIEAARLGGLGPVAILRHHIVPNTAGAVAAYASLTVPEAILGESFLSFLGLGVQEPLTSWGVLIEQGAAKLETAPWMLVPPAVLLAVTLLSLNAIADGLSDALDPADARSARG